MPRYFPTPLRERFTPEIRTHQLRREIVTTMLINDLVDTAGISYAYRITEDVGVGPIDAVRTYVATDAIFGIGHIWRRIRAADMPVALSDRMTLDTRRLIDRAGRWLLNYRPQPLAVGAEINRFAAKVKALTPRMSEWLRGDDKAIVETGSRRVRRRRARPKTWPTWSPPVCTASACSTSSTSPTSPTSTPPRSPTPISR